MKAISLWQPWASLVPAGAKPVETRSWSTSYRGPLAIHAAKTTDGFDELPGDCEGDTEAGWRYGYIGDFQAAYCYQTSDEGKRGDAFLHDLSDNGPSEPSMVPLGAVVATCTLTDVVPIEKYGTLSDARHVTDCPTEVISNQGAGLWLFGIDRDGQRIVHRVEDERPYGDFTPGRYAWLLTDIEAVGDRCPACRRPRHCTTCDDRGSIPVPGGGTACPDCFVATPAECKVCGDYGWSDPVPARGRQGLWEWTP